MRSELMKIGIIADTHNKLNPKINEAFRGVDHIFHAGDIGSLDILNKLRTLAPLWAVYGNMDGYEIVQSLPAFLNTRILNLYFLIIHEIRDVGFFQSRIQRGDFQPQPDIVIFGHTHRPFYEKIEQTLYINPGSATTPRDSKSPTVGYLQIDREGIVSHEFIELNT